MHIQYLEKVFLGLSLVVMAAFLVAIFAAVRVHGIDLPEPSARVDPASVALTPPFDTPGVEEVEPNGYRVTLLAQMWRWTPNEIRIPAGATVTFVMTSVDVIHGFWIGGTSINAMVMPGQVTEVEHTFDQAGEFLIMCHEYCGLGHQAMSGKIIVGAAGSATAAGEPAVDSAAGTGGAAADEPKGDG